MTRKPRTHTSATACETVARDMRTFGYPDVSGKMIEEVLTAWLVGKGKGDLPHGVIGMVAGLQFDEIESAHPGRLSALT